MGINWMRSTSIFISKLMNTCKNSKFKSIHFTFNYSQQIGISYNFIETDEKMYVPFTRITEFARVSLEDKLKSDEV
jgi:hypothetical protein